MEKGVSFGQSENLSKPLSLAHTQNSSFLYAQLENVAGDISPINQFDLFEIPSPENLSPPDLNRPIVLDPSKAYPVPKGYTLIQTELDWLQHFGVANTPCWVRGVNLCNWAEEWLRCWKRSYQIAEIKLAPRIKLVEFLSPISIPQNWTEQQSLAVAIRLEQYQDKAIARLLADLSDTHPQIWLASPSVENLAQWLTIEIPEEAKALEQVWQNQRANDIIGNYYQTQNKQQLLKQWLGLIEPAIPALGSYPIEIPQGLQSEFDSFWERELYRTEGAILDSLKLSDRPLHKRIVKIAYSVFEKRPALVTRVRERQLRPYLNNQQYEKLKQQHRPPIPQPLALNAAPQTALQWVTQEYLPLRRWETAIAQIPQEQRESDRLASSFEDWMLQHYPNLKVDAVADSYLNYNVTHHVQKLSETAPVFWVVVDGLGWLDHQVLLSYLSEHQLQIERGLQPKFSILPTKTEYAKWSLYSQLLPEHESWTGKAGDGFKLQNAKRYTDNDIKLSRLQKALTRQAYQIYCWDTDAFDHLYHDQVNWQELYQIQRPRVLKAIAEDIARYVEMHPQRDEMHIVISSDHGQMMGISAQVPHCPPELSPKGRMALGSTDDPRFVCLDRRHYGLPHEVSIVRGSASFNSFSYGEDKSIIGCHGGLYPEEVVIGFSVLKRLVQRSPIIVACSGAGEAEKPGNLIISLNNPNALALVNLRLYVQELEQLAQGLDLEIEVEANQNRRLEVPIASWPKLAPSHQDNQMRLTGRLEFAYQDAENDTVQLDRQSMIIVNQMFNSGFDINEFF